ncbi:sodium:proton antiporter NhaD [Porphyromonas catoniae]|uniref:sodium:proton antiporter NhaD n=1 Tax=Porphyromonas catoniae TaxID=41976 RepID=UPI0028D38F52|nr:sodium:proton antiporter NhaD [Porphyromonas catoniae]
MISFYLMPVIFVLGILGIAFEEQIKINKTATALLTCVLLWAILLIDTSIASRTEGFLQYIAHATVQSGDTEVSDYLSLRLTEHLGDVSGTLFFVLCSMVLVSTIDSYGGFKSVASIVATTNKRSLLWRVAFASFFFSAFLDNLAASIVIIAVLRKLVPDTTDRMKYACMSIIACNAGGSWSPIGDVTTLLLWNNGRITPYYQIFHLIIPALISLIVPTLLAHFFLFKKGVKLRQRPNVPEDEMYDILPHRARIVVFMLGILSLMLVPIWQTFFDVPAFMGVIFGLVLVWIYTELMFSRYKKRLREATTLRMTEQLNNNADLTTIFYFLGILMSVAALIEGGQLAVASTHVTKLIPSTGLLATIIGVLSSVLDNVALVAAVLGMYPVDASGALSPFVLNGSFWVFLAYCAVNGGSLLIIGSATGVTVMGLEGISFGYYLKRFSLLALSGYLAGALAYQLQSLIF